MENTLIDLAIYKDKKVYVGLSGGVDSAVTAALLQKAGAHITGVFIQGWYPPGQPCSWKEDRRDAMRVAAHLGIPFHTHDAADEYKRAVIDYLLAQYKIGNTPNPDIMCNREVKFGAFYRFAREHGAHFIATGHYAQTVMQGNHAALLRGADESKDQSYFLWAVPRDVLAHTIFPLGNFAKTDVRKMAETMDLPVARKRDSQGICFLGSISIDAFLKQEIQTEIGNATDAEGNKIGTHEGAVLYTLGERVALEHAPPGPWYVVAKDLSANTITVSKSPETPASIDTIALREVNMLDAVSPDEMLEAQYRYHGPKIIGTYDSEENIFTPSATLHTSIAQGQSLVLYRGSTCVGGGIIV